MIVNSRQQVSSNLVFYSITDFEVLIVKKILNRRDPINAFVTKTIYPFLLNIRRKKVTKIQSSKLLLLRSTFNKNGMSFLGKQGTLEHVSRHGSKGKKNRTKWKRKIV